MLIIFIRVKKLQYYLWVLDSGHHVSISGILFHLNVILNLRAVFGILINESNKCGGVPLFFNWVQNQLHIRQCYYQLISWSFFIKGSRCLQRDLQRKFNLMNTVELKPKIIPMKGLSKTSTRITVRLFSSVKYVTSKWIQGRNCQVTISSTIHQI